uniref:Uncharacterized protein n=1 Tax=viral metagenome TaxID=1070528 RepID=A0A6C0D173_9ZZZZ
MSSFSVSDLANSTTIMVQKGVITTPTGGGTLFCNADGNPNGTGSTWTALPPTGGVSIRTSDQNSFLTCYAKYSSSSNIDLYSDQCSTIYSNGSSYTVNYDKDMCSFTNNS